MVISLCWKNTKWACCSPGYQYMNKTIVSTVKRKRKTSPGSHQCVCYGTYFGPLHLSLFPFLWLCCVCISCHVFCVLNGIRDLLGNGYRRGCRRSSLTAPSSTTKKNGKKNKNKKEVAPVTRGILSCLLVDEVTCQHAPGDQQEEVNHPAAASNPHELLVPPFFCGGMESSRWLDHLCACQLFSSSRCGEWKYRDKKVAASSLLVSCYLRTIARLFTRWSREALG